MKKTYMTPETEVIEAFIEGSILKDQSEPQASGWVGGNTGEFDEGEAKIPESGYNQNLWED